MSRGDVTSRYARALLKFSQANGDGEKTCDQARRLEETLDVTAKLREVISDAQAVRMGKKMELLRDAVLPEKLTASMEGFLRLVLRNGRAAELRFILHTFRIMYLRSMNLHLATLVTATEPPAGLADEIRGMFEKKIGGSLRIISRVDPSIIGGMVLYIDDFLYDGSVSGQLEKLRRSFVEKNRRIL